MVTLSLKGETMRVRHAARLDRLQNGRGCAHSPLRALQKRKVFQLQPLLFV